MEKDRLERKDVLLRIDMETYKLIEADAMAQGVTVTAWFINAAQNNLKTVSVVQTDVDTKGFDKLLKERLDWVKKLDGFVDLEKEFLEGRPCAGSEDAKDEFYRDKRIAGEEQSIKDRLWNDYFEPLDTMDKAQHAAYAQAIINQSKAHEQDLAKCVSKNPPLTTKMVLDKFDIKEEITMDDIIEAFNCSYNVAWHNIKPCLESHGYKVVLGKGYHTVPTSD